MASLVIKSCASETVEGAGEVLEGLGEKRSGKGRMKASGAQSRPTMKARLKLIVASMLRTAPSRRREKDCRIWSCWWGSLERW